MRRFTSVRVITPSNALIPSAIASALFILSSPVLGNVVLFELSVLKPLLLESVLAVDPDVLPELFGVGVFEFLPETVPSGLITSPFGR
ncbi:hypothetical protein LL184_1533 [Lactococcus lactis subsp. lactis]|nr:hypothetical protein LL184_1533 [Lactococcus lactis subsp. lactis]